MLGSTNSIVDYNQSDYREFWKGPNKVLLDRAERLIIMNLLSENQGWFIDLGAGFGRLLPLYNCPERRVVMVDYALNLLEIAAQKHTEGHIHFIAANAYRLPFRDGVFSGGLSVRVFHHMDSPINFLKECSRILSPQGEMVLSYSNKRNLLRILRKWKSAFQVNHEAYSSSLFGTHPDYFRFISEEAGLEEKKVSGCGILDQLVREFPSIERHLARCGLISELIYWMEKLANHTLGNVGLTPLHFSALKKHQSNMNNANPLFSSGRFEDILVCPNCYEGEIKDQEIMVACTKCNSTYRKIGKVLDFRKE